MKKKEKPCILVFTDWFAPAYKAGGPIRSCVNFAHAMSNVYNIYVLTSNTDFGNEELDVITDQWVEFGSNIKVQYLTKEAETSANLISIINEIGPKYVYLNSMFSVFYTLTPLYFMLKTKLDVKIILAPRGMLHEGAIQYKYLKKKLLLSLLKWSGRVNGIYFQATDEQERKDIIKHLNVRDENIQVVPNFPQGRQNLCKPITKQANELKLVFISRIAPKKNILFFLECLKALDSQPNIELSIYGSVEEGYWEECQKNIKKLSHNIRVNYKGSINHQDVAETIEAYHFLMLSTFGENFGHAIFEAFATGRPVIISDQTPWQNLEKQKIGWDIALNNQQKWLEAIEYAANMEQKEFDEWCQSAWDYAHDFIHHSGIKEKYLQLFSL